MNHETVDCIKVCVATQKILVLTRKSLVVYETACSTALNGTGQLFGSYCTPLGKHSVIAIAGINAPMQAKFSARIPSMIKTVVTRDAVDPIVSRIFWLAGTQPGFNQGGDVDTKARRIYIHGTTEVETLGTPCSLGCIRVAPTAAIDLQQWIQVGTSVEILKRFLPSLPGV